MIGINVLLNLYYIYVHLISAVILLFIFGIIAPLWIAAPSDNTLLATASS
ncbi:hypothetical protein [Sphingobacterium sp. HMA12]|nr:hypothetical protein [Sphingobacterium sp. HMA12]